MSDSGKELTLLAATAALLVAGAAARWLIVDVLLVRVCYPLIRFALGTRLCDRVEERWVKLYRHDRMPYGATSSPGLIRYTVYSLVVASIVLHTAALLPLDDAPPAFAYHFRDQAVLNDTAASSESVLTLVEVRLGWPHLAAVQLDSESGVRWRPPTAAMAPSLPASTWTGPPRSLACSSARSRVRTSTRSCSPSTPPRTRCCGCSSSCCCSRWPTGAAP